MADTLIDSVTYPAKAPGADQGILYVDSAFRRMTARVPGSAPATLLGGITNSSTTDQAVTDAYIDGSSLRLPPTGMQFGTIFRWNMALTKGATGGGTMAYVVRIGTAGTIADTARLTFTFTSVATAVVDTGFANIEVVVRNVGTAGVLAGVLQFTHPLTLTGFLTGGDMVVQTTSAAFDNTVANSVVGLSMTTNAVATTYQVVSSQAINL